MSQNQDVVLEKTNKLSNSQLWYEDKGNKVIRSMLDDNFVLQVLGDKVVVSSFSPPEYNQKFVRKGDRLIHAQNDQWVLSVKPGGVAGTGIGAGNLDMNNGMQKFDFKHDTAKLMYVVNPGTGDVLDCRGGNTKEGGEVILWKKGEPSPNQLFFEDRYGVLCNSDNKMALDGGGKKVYLQPADIQIEQRCWTLCASKIVNIQSPDHLLECQFSLGNKVSGLFRKAGEDIVNIGKADKYTGKPEQKFTPEYV
eukprot:Trichotokara_eunicae@DN6292_c0_g1_i2.p1